MTEKQKENTKPHYEGHRGRLRTRFLQDFGRSMPDYELLELLLTAGIPRKDVKELAKNLINRFGDLAGTITASPAELTDAGVPFIAMTHLKAVFVTAQKLSWIRLRDQNLPVLANIDGLIDYCRTSMAYQKVEEVRIIFLDGNLRIIRDQLMQKGTVNAVNVHTREIVQETLNAGASSVILVHNHPSGNCTPSAHDKKFTRELFDALLPLDIKLLDHFIVTTDDYFSFREHNLIQI